MPAMDANDFYEDDEPVEKIVEVFERGEKFLTTPPSLGRTQHLVIPGLGTSEATAYVSSQSLNKPAGQLVLS
jgi:hypothetical protein